MAQKNKSRADEIVRAASKLFAERGYDGVSVRDICAELSVNCSIVSYYFSGKRGLYLEVLARQFSAYEKALAAVADGGGSPREKLSAIIGAMGRIREEHPHFSAIIVRESGSPSPEFLQVANDYKSDGLLTELIRDGQRLGQFKKGARANSLAMALSLLLNGVAAASAFGQDGLAEKEYYEAVALLFDGLANPHEEAEAGRRLGKQSARPRTNWSR